MQLSTVHCKYDARQCSAQGRDGQCISMQSRPRSKLNAANESRLYRGQRRPLGCLGRLVAGCLTEKVSLLNPAWQNIPPSGQWKNSRESQWVQWKLRSVLFYNRNYQDSCGPRIGTLMKIKLNHKSCSLSRWTYGAVELLGMCLALCRSVAERAEKPLICVDVIKKSIQSHFIINSRVLFHLATVASHLKE